VTQIIAGLVFIVCGIGSVLGLLARIEDVRKGHGWDRDDSLMLQGFLVATVLSGAAVVAGMK
jgi:hypothetical protein